MQSGPIPPGWFDCVDSELTSFQGGEVCTLIGVTLGTDASTSIYDGYVGTTTKQRPAVSKANLTSNSRPLFLADDGTTGYGTLFGVVIGTMGGQTNGTIGVGPHSAAASGKITVHNEPAVYAVTLDSVDATTLVPSNGALTVGTALSYTTNGLLTTGGTGTRVGTFLEFTNQGSLVSTPTSIVAAVSSPSGGTSATQVQRFKSMMFNFAPPSA